MVNLYLPHFSNIYQVVLKDFGGFRKLEPKPLILYMGLEAPGKLKYEECVIVFFL